MEMEKNSPAHHLQQHHLQQHHLQQQHFSGQPLGDATGLSCARQPPRAQAGTPERAPPLRSKQQNAKGPATKKIFPWMKESRHSDEKGERRIAGLCDTRSERPFSFLTPSARHCVFVLKIRKSESWMIRLVSKQACSFRPKILTYLSQLKKSKQQILDTTDTQ